MNEDHPDSVATNRIVYVHVQCNALSKIVSFLQNHKPTTCHVGVTHVNGTLLYYLLQTYRAAWNFLGTRGLAWTLWPSTHQVLL